MLEEDLVCRKISTINWLLSIIKKVAKELVQSWFRQQLMENIKAGFGND